MTYFCVAAGVIGIAVLLIALELRRFKVTTYEFQSSKIQSPVTLLFLSDVHGKTFSGRVLQKIKELSPDKIILGGDMVSKNHEEELEPIGNFIEELTRLTTVYYCFGNHETTIEQVLAPMEPEYERAFNEYKEKLVKAGVVFLRNSSIQTKEKLRLIALELPSEYYRKFQVMPLEKAAMEEFLKDAERKAEEYTILMAHHPVFADTYKELEPDLILSGHTHGGLVRFPFIGSIISTELTWFPRYDGGSYTLITDKKRIPLVVSKGLGYHSYPIRIFDRAEMIQLRLMPK